MQNVTVTLYRAGVGELGTTTANGSGAWSYDYTGTTLPEGKHSFAPTQTGSGETSHRSKLFPVVVDTTAPDVTLTADGSACDFSPGVVVVVTDEGGIKDGATVALDVDLNNDGIIWMPERPGTPLVPLTMALPFWS